MAGADPMGEEPSFEPVYLELRSMVLELDPSAVGIAPSDELPNVWGVVVDWGLEEGSATFVALADGTGSMYTSSGGGTIGGGGRPALVAAGRALLRAAEHVQSHLPPAVEFAAPRLREVRYWILTFDGARSARHGPDGPPPDDAVLGYLGAAFQDYVTAFRLDPVGDGRDEEKS